MDWLSALQQLRRDGRPGVLVTVLAVRGHAPRDAGAKMVVGADHLWGSVGGGNLEAEAVHRARELLAQAQVQARAVTTPEILEFGLNPHAKNRHGQQCCGGDVRLLLEFLPARPTIAIFGLGHVGYELARILSRLEVHLHLVDSRSEQLDPLRLAGVTDGSAEVSVHHAVLGERVLELLPSGAQVLIMTHDHAEDLALCDAALRRPELASIGLIGSRAKRARFRRTLGELGHPDEVIDRITSPIGDPDLRGKEPAVIAIGVASAVVKNLATSGARSRPEQSRPEPSGPERSRPVPSGPASSGPGPKRPTGAGPA